MNIEAMDRQRRKALGLSDTGRRNIRRNTRRGCGVMGCVVGAVMFVAGMLTGWAVKP